MFQADTPPERVHVCCAAINDSLSHGAGDGSRDLRESDGHRRVLWIDDQVVPDVPEIRFLTLQGFQVHCAPTGRQGIAMARSGVYDGMILDLHLPDVPGLAVLSSLRAAGIRTPVLVLTGFADYESALAAGALGVTAFKSKPLFLEELAYSVSRLIEESTDGSNSRSLSHGPVAVEMSNQALGQLLAGLQSLRLPRDAGRPAGHLASDILFTRRDPASVVVGVLLHSLRNPALNVRGFLGCIAGFRKVASTAMPSSLRELAEEVRDAVLRAAGQLPPFDATVVRSLADIEEAVTNGHRPTEEEIAKDCNIDPAHLGRLLRTKTGLSFREWRRAFVLKAAVHYLADGDEQVKQIACRRLGFEHESQFDREFRDIFGVTPTEFRRLSRTIWAGRFRT